MAADSAAGAAERPGIQSADPILELTAGIVSAYVSHNSIPPSQLPELIQTVFRSLSETGETGAAPRGKAPKPAIPVRRTVQPDYLVCLEDGKRLKMLKRHLRTNYNLTPEQYRAKWGLPADYPMVAPNYAKRRSEFAKKIGLGQKRPEKTGPPAPIPG